VNIFAHIKLVLPTTKVNYYSVYFEGEEFTEFGKFVLNHSDLPSIAKEYGDIRSWLKFRFGEIYGALEDHFRPEDEAQALPPFPEKLKISYKRNLRLYCLRISDNVVFLFNGGIKTNGVQFAQDCPIVGHHFEKANQLSIAIKEAFILNDLQLNIDQTELIIAPGFRLEI